MAPRDEDRQLTQHGQLTVRDAALEFHERIALADLPPPDLCLFSPLVRTRETSQILAAEWVSLSSPVLHSRRAHALTSSRLLLR